MSRDQEPRAYTPEEVYGLIRSGWHSSQIELAEAYNSLPYRIDGIAIQEYASPPTFEDDESTIVAFNAELPAEELSILRRSREDFIKIPEMASLGWVTRKRIELSRAQLAGSIGINGIVSIGGGYKNKERRQATTFMKATKERFLDPAQGYVSLLRDKTYTYPHQTGVQSESATAWESLVHYSAQYALFSATEVLPGIWPPLDDSLRIVPSALVKGMIVRSKNPRELWYDGFGELVHELSNTEKQLIASERRLQATRNPQSLMGIESSEEIERHASETEEVKLQLLVISHQIVALSEEWRMQQAKNMRIKIVEKVMDDIAGGESDEVHPLEMQIQTFTTIASSALSHLDPANKDTLTVANRLYGHLSDLRKHLTSPTQIEQFYRNLYVNLSEAMPELPAWEAVADEFTPKPVEDI